MNSKEILELVKGHKSLQEHKDFWEFLHDSYKGGEDYLKGGYLSKHSKEPQTNYKKRCEASSYANFVAPVVDTYADYIFSSNIKREITVPETYNKLLDNINNNFDLKESTASEVMRELGVWTMVYGRMLAIIDTPIFEGELSLQQSIDEEIQPYVTMYQPTSIVNWTMTPPGMGPRKLLSLVLFEGDEGKERFYKIWTNDAWLLVSVEGSKVKHVADGENKLGYIPYVNITYKSGFSEDFDDGESLVSDISKLSQRIYNLDSNALEITEHTTFPILALPVRDGESNDHLIGVGNAIPIDPDAPNSLPQWIAPPTNNLDAIQSWRKQSVEDIQELSFMIGSVSGSSQSGLALETRQQSLHSTLGALAIKLQKAETKMYMIMFDYLNIEAEVDIAYPTSFAVRDLSTDLDSAIKAKSIIKSNTFAQKLDNALAHKVLSKLASDDTLTQEDKDAIIDELGNSQENDITNIIGNINNQG